MIDLDKARLNTAVAGRYVLVQKIGNGSYTEVYEAKDRVLKRAVAMKMLKRELKGDSSILARFISMAHVTAEIQHPHVIPVFDIGDSEPFMVMPLIEAGDIVTCRRRRQQQRKLFSTAEFIYLLYSVSHALLTAHRKGFVHANLSPKNILLLDGAFPIITDFALDRRKGSVFHKSLASSDTFPYLSLEQWDGQEVNPATDQYSLALVMYFLLSGKHPPRTTRKDGGMQDLFTTELFPNSAPSIARKVVELLRRCLQEDGAQRFPSMLSMVSELDSLKERAFKSGERRGYKPESGVEEPPSERAVRPPTEVTSPPLVLPEPPPEPRKPLAPPPQPVPKPSPPEDPERLFATAKELIRGRQFETALDILDRLKTIDFQSVMVQRLEREAKRRLSDKKKVNQLIQDSLNELKAGNLEKAEQKLVMASQLDRNNDQVTTLLEKVKTLRAKRDAAKAEVVGNQTIVMKEPVRFPAIEPPVRPLKPEPQSIIVSVTSAPPLADFLAAQG